MPPTNSADDANDFNRRVNQGDTLVAPLQGLAVLLGEVGAR
jgi:hypothetical protein